MTLERSAEQTTDKQRLRRIHELLVGYDGEDQFVIHIADGTGGGIELRFPNQGTVCCPKLIHDLEALVGDRRAISVEEGP